MLKNEGLSLAGNRTRAPISLPGGEGGGEGGADRGAALTAAFVVDAFDAGAVPFALPSFV